MYWNQGYKFIFLTLTGWLLTLDVLKFLNHLKKKVGFLPLITNIRCIEINNLLLRRLCRNWLITNIRCIEIISKKIGESKQPAMLITNIRCIEIYRLSLFFLLLYKLITNIRCIEIISPALFLKKLFVDY